MAISTSEAKAIKKIINSPSKTTSSGSTSVSPSKYKGATIHTTASGQKVRVREGQDVEKEIASNIDPIPTPKAPITPPEVDAVDTTQPSPSTVDATAFTQPKAAAPAGEVPYDQAVKNLNNGGLQGADLQRAQQTLASKYKQAHSQATSSGIAAPTDGGAARTGMTQFVPPTPPQEDFSHVDQMLQEDKGWQEIQTLRETYFSPKEQKTSLLNEYKKLYKDAGLDDLDEEILDAKTIIEGTEDDIRNEVEMAGGFATDSQVQALASARNKVLLKNYNNLVALKEMKENRLNTTLSLVEKDRAYADSQFEKSLNFEFKVMEYKDKFVNNTRDQINRLADKIGMDGVFNAYSSNPRQLAFAEKIMGLAPGGLSKAASMAATERATAAEKDNLDIEMKRENIKTERLQQNNIQSQIDERKGKNTPTVTPQSQAKAKSDIDLVDGLVTDSYLDTAVGPNALARKSPLNIFTGGKSNFIAGVEQLRSQLTLDTLISAKERGATFGALSDAEMKTLSSAGSKLGSWAKKDKDGNIVGYSTSEKEFKKELDKINNFAKLDYLRKGGTPEEIGAQTMEDGSVWVQNSDGSYTQIQ